MVEGREMTERLNWDDQSSLIAKSIVALYDKGGRFRAELLPHEVIKHILAVCIEELDKRKSEQTR